MDCVSVSESSWGFSGSCAQPQKIKLQTTVKIIIDFILYFIYDKSNLFSFFGLLFFIKLQTKKYQ